MKKSSLLVLAALVLMVGSAFSQSGAFAPYVDAGISASSTFTGTNSVTAINPNYTVGAGIESSTKYLLLDVHANFNSQNYRTFGISAIGSGDAYAATVQGTGFLKVGKLLLGGGTFYQDTVTAKTIRSLDPSAGQTFVPLIGGGFQFSRDRITALYELPGRSATNQRTVDFHNEIFLTKKGHLRLTQDVSLNSSVASAPALNVSQRISGGSAGAGIKLVF
jgi:hypothetical protein